MHLTHAFQAQKGRHFVLRKNELQDFGSIFYKAEVKLPPSSSNKVLILKRTLSQTDFFFIC
ncbi:hypothetical protein LEP1GSC125_1608 [Leptospira mayottensis 200901122]|uniref:Uncharacterized protein n=1 Tax=Leptospira mayottensis 200901122 TaxID=1193010 RepID=A0AA87MM54_9LEPT|nr:hypothetical protein LEP1GSC125_1608 [Leptospira mayottensis 200901122]